MTRNADMDPSVDESTLRRNTGSVPSAQQSADPDTANAGEDYPWWFSATSARLNDASKASRNADQDASSRPGTYEVAHRPSAALPAAGWYADPHSERHLRWWDGRAWTATTHPC